MRFTVIDRRLTLKLTLQECYTDCIQLAYNKAQSLPFAKNGELISGSIKYLKQTHDQFLKKILYSG